MLPKDDTASTLKDLEILPMTFDDLEDVLSIERLSYPSPWSRSQFEKELQNRFSNKLVAKVAHDNREVIAAFIIFWVVADEAHILNIAVRPDFRRKGIAKSLLFFTLNNLEERGVKEAFLEVRRSNSAAQSLYNYFSFKKVGVRRGYYGDNNEDAIVMALEIKRARKIDFDDEEGYDGKDFV